MNLRPDLIWQADDRHADSGPPHFSLGGVLIHQAKRLWPKKGFPALTAHLGADVLE